MSKIFIGLFALVMLGVAPAVQADPIVITSGTLSVNSSASASYTLNGLNFSVTSVGGDSGNSPAMGCKPCASGQLVSTSTFLVGSSLGSGPATINGTSFSQLVYFGHSALGNVCSAAGRNVKPFVYSPIQLCWNDDRLPGHFCSMRY